MRFDIRHAAGVELASDGVPVSKEATLRRGLLVIGRRLLTERDASLRAGQAARRLNTTEQRALQAALDERDRRA